MQIKPTAVTPEQLRSTALDILSLPKEKQALVYGFMQGVLSVKEPLTIAPPRRRFRPRAPTSYHRPDGDGAVALTDQYGWKDME